MQKSKFENLEELEKSFNEVYSLLNSFIANEGIYYDTALYATLESARTLLSNVPRYFNQYDYDKD